MLEEILSIIFRPITTPMNYQIGALVATVEEIRDQIAGQITDLKTSLTAALDRVAADVAHLQETLDVPPETFEPVVTGIAEVKASLDALDPLADFPAPEPPPEG